ncbi:MAG TPA: hypothetical protein DEF78_10415 [Sphingobacterium sp.]|nr:hypothetical protein [Sphingobacterium sp.]
MKLDPKSPNKKQSYETAQKKICPIPAMPVRFKTIQEIQLLLAGGSAANKKKQQHKQAHGKALQYFNISTGSDGKLPKTR